MGELMIINGSPRAAKSNSKEYANIFKGFYRGSIDAYNITKNNHKDICDAIDKYEDILFVFPLYVDSIPVTLLNFLKFLEENKPKNKPNINVMINCGFIEYEQNDVCIKMIKLFCKQNGYTFGSVLSIGGGEAILNTPFRFLVRWKIKKLAESIYNKKFNSLNITMPISKKFFIKASTKYWINYGQKNGVTRSEMETMKIE